MGARHVALPLTTTSTHPDQTSTSPGPALYGCIPTHVLVYVDHGRCRPLLSCTWMNLHSTCVTDATATQSFRVLRNHSPVNCYTANCPETCLNWPEWWAKTDNILVIVYITVDGRKQANLLPTAGEEVFNFFFFAQLWRFYILWNKGKASKPSWSKVEWGGWSFAFPWRPSMIMHQCYS